jgi:hypothetical protein
LQVIKTIGVHLQLMVGVLVQQLQLVLPKQTNGTHQLQPILLPEPGDLVKSLFYLSIIKPNTRIRTMLLQINNKINNSSSNTVLYH